MEELRTAIEAAEWPRALGLALDAWRALRVAPLADLIDALDVLCPPVRPTGQIVEWWRSLAETHDPVVRGCLLRSRLVPNNEPWPRVRERIASSPVAAALDAAMPQYPLDKLEIVERLAYMLEWDDPRAAMLLAGWFLDGVPRWSFPAVVEVIYRAIAARLIALGDERVRPMIATAVDRPRGPTQTIRRLQRELAADVIARLRTMPATDAQLAAIAACATSVPSPRPRSRDPREDELWHAIAEAPHDLERRSVLADFLVERGDPRGEVIALQLAGTPHAMTRANRLIAKHWKQWLGDLALAVTRRGTEFDRGMLAAIRVGVYETPVWVYERVRGHRELSTVHTVRAHYVAAGAFAALVDGLPNEPHTIGIDMPEMLDELRARRSTWTVREVEYRQTGQLRPQRTWPAYDATLAAIAATFPHCEHLLVGDTLPTAVLTAAFGSMPRLQRITLEVEPWVVREVSARYAAVPRVAVVARSL